ncbi:ATP binding [Venturia nashicola]|uniref:Origin recognition complex subunit 4 n=1 Tax=Venturia nashicola TaxID=86259 RepID=A0A4Z1P5R5_9PEZI|nr:ATP binding [Venturia nashicola]
MARKVTETPMTAKRRKLNDTTAPSSAPAKRKSKRDQELDLYDDIDGGLTKSEPKKKRGWKGWVEIDEDEVTSEEEEVVATTTPAKRQTKLKASGSLSSIAKKASISGKSKGTPKDRAVLENDEDENEDETRATASKETGRSTAKNRFRRKAISSEESDKELPEAESPTKRLVSRRRSAGSKKVIQEDEDMEDVGIPAKSTARKRKVSAKNITIETPSKAQNRPRKGIEEDGDESESEELAIARTPSKTQKSRRQLRQLDDTNEESEAMDIDLIQETPASHKMTATNGIYADKTIASAEITLIKSIVLSKLTQRRPVPLTNLDTEYAKVHQLLEATVNSGESNSMLLIGARGSGKTALINRALLELSRSQKQHFHIVRLNGFVQTDDKLALREIWRQLGREMEIEDEEGTTNKSYADTLAMLLALLSHPDEISAESGDQTAKSVLFIMDEFDLFAQHPRQTLLYNLLDIAQSRKAPIAVLGLTTRIDVTEALEKRVKSRFSHRYVHLNLARTLSEFVDVAKSALKILPAELSFEEKTVLVNSEALSTKKKGHKLDTLESWNRAIDSIFANTTFQRIILHPPYHTSKSLPTLFSSLLLPITSLTSLPTPSDFLSTQISLTPPSSNLHLLSSLSNLALSLLIAASRLSIIHNTTTTNFPLAYAEYVNLASKARINANAAGQLATGSGMRVYGKEVARREWEGLVKLGLCVRVGGGAFGAGNAVGGGGGRDMVRVDVALEEIPASVFELGNVMEKWCKQI